MANQAVEEKQHCSICGKEGTVMSLQIPGEEATPPVCSDCFDERMARVKDELARKPQRLTESVLREELMFLQGVQGHLHECEQMLIAFISRWAGRAKGPQTEVRQMVTKALVSVQGAQARIARTAKPWADIVPDEDGLFVTQ